MAGHPALLQEEWKRKIEEVGGVVHAKIKKGLHPCIGFFNQIIFPFTQACYFRLTIRNTMCKLLLNK